MWDIIGETVGVFAAKMKGRQTKALERGTDGSEILGSIYMNMPNAIQFNEAASWSGTPPL